MCLHCKVKGNRANIVRAGLRAILMFLMLFFLPEVLLGAISPALAHNSVEKLMVRSIRVEIRPIFGGQQPVQPFSTVQSIKISTKESVIRQHLLFKEGDEVTQFDIDESTRILRTQKYLRGARIISHVEDQFVDVVVIVQDTWSTIPLLSYAFGGGNEHKTFGVEESNLAGWGKRLEVLYDEDIGRKSLDALWHDPHLWGSNLELLTGVFDRNDGEIYMGRFGEPFRSLAEKNSWLVDAFQGHVVGRLFRDGEEKYIFRRRDSLYGFSYSLATGPPQTNRRRISIGYRYDRNLFGPARPKDYTDLGLTAADIDHSPELLPKDRRYSGPTFGYSVISPHFISMNYIDRFERIQDFDVGRASDVILHYAPKALGSLKDTLLLSMNHRRGVACGPGAFINAEVGAASGIDHDGFFNTLLRAEFKRYDVIGQLYLGDFFLGRHTLAYSYYIDYGIDLDRDRQFLVGGNNALRGYDVAAFSGNKRMALNFENRIHLIDDLWQVMSVGVAFFADLGGATEQSIGDLLVERVYSDMGVGLRLAFPRVSGSRVFRIDLAVPMRAGPDGTEAGDLRILFSGGQLFSSGLRSQAIGVEAASVGIGFDR